MGRNLLESGSVVGEVERVGKAFLEIPPYDKGVSPLICWFCAVLAPSLQGAVGGKQHPTVRRRGELQQE